MPCMGYIPLAFLHPLIDGTLGVSHFPVEGMKILVIRAPTAVGTIDNIDNASLVTLVRVVVHAEQVAPLVEGDFLWVA